MFGPKEVVVVPKYIFKQEEYMKYRKENPEYTSHVLQSVNGGEYKILKVRGTRMPGCCLARDKYGYGGDIWIGINEFALGGVYESHKHETAQMYIVLSGKAKLRVGNEERIAEKGTWVYTPPGIEHSVENIGDEPFAYIFIGGNPKEKESKAHEIIRNL